MAPGSVAINGFHDVNGVNGVNGTHDVDGIPSKPLHPHDAVRFDPKLAPKRYQIKGWKPLLKDLALALRRLTYTIAGTPPESKILFLDVNMFVLDVDDSISTC